MFRHIFFFTLLLVMFVGALLAEGLGLVSVGLGMLALLAFRVESGRGWR